MTTEMIAADINKLRTLARGLFNSIETDRATGMGVKDSDTRKLDRVLDKLDYMEAKHPNL